jgi:hypothetical protein
VPGATQEPATQLCEQQSLATAQLCPFGLHAADAHLPETQSWLQQSVLAVHSLPSLAHVGASHAPPVHDPLQQSPFP